MTEYTIESGTSLADPDEMNAPKGKPVRRARKSKQSAPSSHSETAESTPISPPEQVPPDQPLVQVLHTWRQKDNRVWNDLEIEEFPQTFFYNLHQEEWKEKALLWDKLKSYLQTNPGSDLRILDAGCGSGWLSHKISQVVSGKVFGIDIDPAQVTSAKKMFQSGRVSFLEGDIRQSKLEKESFDHIILMDVLPWVEDLHGTIRHCLSLLKDQGELHLMGTPFFNRKQLDQAKEAFRLYCTEKRMENVLPFRFFHSKEDLAEYRTEDMMRSAWWSRSGAPTWLKLKR